MSPDVLQVSSKEKDYEESAYNFYREKIADFDLSNAFPQVRPLEVEIGCGKGKFLIDRAELKPDVNFLGIDTAGKWMKIGRVRSEKKKLKNLRFIRADFRNVLLDHLKDASVSVFHIYFPDPWPKRRHRRRRLISVSFLSLLYDRLTAEGSLNIATDHQDYYEHIKQVIQDAGIPWRTVLESNNQRISGDECRTNYEIKYAAAGRQLHYLELNK